MVKHQNTFEIVPNVPVGLPGLGPALPPPANATAGGPQNKPPMTSKQAKKLYKEKNKAPKLSRAEQRRLELAEQERIRREIEKDRQANRARAARERKKAKEADDRERKKKSGQPLVPCNPSQDTIARFVRGNGLGRKRDSAGKDLRLETVAEQSETEGHTDHNDQGSDKENTREREKHERKGTEARKQDTPTRNVERRESPRQILSPSAKRRRTAKIPSSQPEEMVVETVREAPPPKNPLTILCSFVPVQSGAHSRQSNFDVDGPATGALIESQLIAETVAASMSTSSDRRSTVVPSSLPPKHQRPSMGVHGTEPVEAPRLPEPRLPKPTISCPPLVPQARPHLQIARETLPAQRTPANAARSYKLPLAARSNTSKPSAFVSATRRPPISRPPVMRTLPAPPKFKVPVAVGTSAPPKFLAKQPETTTGRLPRTANGSNRFHQRPREDGNPPPTSTQLFVLNHLDELFPSPSQEARELMEDGIQSAPSKPVLARPICQTITAAGSARRAIGREMSAVSTRPPPKASVSAPLSRTEAEPFPFFSTQDLVLSSQDLMELEESPTIQCKGKTRHIANSTIVTRNLPAKNRSFKRITFATDGPTSRMETVNREPSMSTAQGILASRTSPRLSSKPGLTESRQRNPLRQLPSLPAPPVPAPKVRDSASPDKFKRSQSSAGSIPSPSARPSAILKKPNAPRASYTGAKTKRSQVSAGKDRAALAFAPNHQAAATAVATGSVATPPAPSSPPKKRFFTSSGGEAIYLAMEMSRRTHREEERAREAESRRCEAAEKQVEAMRKREREREQDRIRQYQQPPQAAAKTIATEEVDEDLGDEALDSLLCDISLDELITTGLSPGPRSREARSLRNPGPEKKNCTSTRASVPPPPAMVQKASKATMKQVDSGNLHHSGHANKSQQQQPPHVRTLKRTASSSSRGGASHQRNNHYNGGGGGPPAPLAGSQETDYGDVNFCEEMPITCEDDLVYLQDDSFWEDESL